MKVFSNKFEGNYKLNNNYSKKSNNNNNFWAANDSHIQ